MTLASRSHGHESGSRFRALGAILPFLYLALCGSASAQQLGQGADDGISVWRIVVALVVCGGVAAVAALFLKYRMQGGIALFRTNRNGPRLAMVESLRLRPQTDLCIVSCDQREFLIVVSPQGTHLLCAQSGCDARDSASAGEA